MKQLSTTSFLLLCYLISISLSSCSKGEELVAAEEAIFFCSIDNKEWMPAAPDSWHGNPKRLQYYPESGFLGLSAERETVDGTANESLSFSVKPAKVGINFLSFDKRVLLDWKTPGNCGAYNMDTTALNRNWIYIAEIDEEKRRIQGVFQFDLISQGDECSDQVRNVTNGQFDFHY